MVGDSVEGGACDSCFFTSTGMGKIEREQETMPDCQLQGLPLSTPFSLVTLHLPKVSNQCHLLRTRHSSIGARGETLHIQITTGGLEKEVNLVGISQLAGN